MKFCFHCGLYKQGLLHDLSKYSWIEFSTGVKYFLGNRSPNALDKELHGYSAAWLHHKGRNKHHWEYWLDISKGDAVPALMPINYVVEMFCDRIAATMVYQKKDYLDEAPLAYFMRFYDFVIMHPQTKQLLQMMLEYLATNGQAETFIFVKEQILKQGYTILAS